MCRMRAMLIFAFFPLAALVTQPLAGISVWFPAILIGLAAAGHQAWSANIFSTVGDMFPKSTIASVTGMGAMAGGVGSFIINKCAGSLFDFSAGKFALAGKEYLLTADNLNSIKELGLNLPLNTNASVLVQKVTELGGQVIQEPMSVMGFLGKPAGYMVVFCCCAVAYLIAWGIMKALVPRYSPIKG